MNFDTHTHTHTHIGIRVGLYLSYHSTNVKPPHSQPRNMPSRGTVPSGWLMGSCSCAVEGVVKHARGGKLQEEEVKRGLQGIERLLGKTNSLLPFHIPI